MVTSEDLQPTLSLGTVFGEDTHYRDRYLQRSEFSDGAASSVCASQEKQTDPPSHLGRSLSGFSLIYQFQRPALLSIISSWGAELVKCLLGKHRDPHKMWVTAMGSWNPSAG